MTNRITYTDKEYLLNDTSVPDKNKVLDTDMNQIKSVVNNNADELDTAKQDITDLETEQATQNNNIQANADNISTINTKLSTIEAGAEVNIIEDVKVNGTSLEVTDKSVNVSVPKKTSDLTNDSGFITKEVNNLTNYTTSTETTAEINSRVNDEALLRQNADNNLQSQIDAITVSSDVIDVLGTYQDLQNYDTQHVKANDLIKVLQDSTHSNAMSYFRWVITDHVGAWVYVGSEGPFYTRSESDTLLNTKQNEITPTNKLLSDLVNDTNQTNKFVTSEDKTNWNAKYTKPVSGIPQTDLTSEVQNILTNAESTENKVTSLTSSSTDTQYPSAKAVHDRLVAQDAEITALQEENVELDERLEFLENLSENAELTWKQIQTIVQAGKASKYFKVGDQIETTWKDTATNTTYDVPLDVVSLEDVIIDDDGVEKTVPGMILQWHYCTPFGVQFSQNQAFYYCAETLPAGTYYITIGSNWGNNCHSGYMYEFTTTQDIPAGGQILLGKASSEVSALPDSAPSTWRVRTYSSASSTTPLEILTLTEYTSGTPSGTSLGTLSSNTKYNTTLNNLYSSAYGHNRWKNSAVRQFLNSNENAENWFNMPSDDVFARKPDQLSSKNGFLTGVDSELLAVIKPTKVATAINTNRDSEIGTWDYTYDKFFIPSLEQIYCVPQISGEGAYWNYWKTKSGKTSPNAQYSTNANMITYAVENHSSAQIVRLRSAYRSYSYFTWLVTSSGHFYSSIATYASRFSPACVIC